MTPQSADFLAAADRTLGHARVNLKVQIPEQAARLAYYAQFHAAQALIFERAGKIAKTHKGVNTQFHRLAAVEVGLAPGLARELSRAFRYKEIADYETGAGAVIAPDEAVAAIATAELFVAAIRQALENPAAPP